MLFLFLSAAQYKYTDKTTSVPETLLAPHEKTKGAPEAPVAANDHRDPGNTAIFDEKIEIPKRCKGVHCVDLGESFPTRRQDVAKRPFLEIRGRRIQRRQA